MLVRGKEKVREPNFWAASWVHHLAMPIGSDLASLALPVASPLPATGARVAPSKFLAGKFAAEPWAGTGPGVIQEERKPRRVLETGGHGQAGARPVCGPCPGLPVGGWGLLML